MCRSSSGASAPAVVPRWRRAHWYADLGTVQDKLYDAKESLRKFTEDMPAGLLKSELTQNWVDLAAIMEYLDTYRKIRADEHDQLQKQYAPGG